MLYLLLLKRKVRSMVIPSLRLLYSSLVSLSWRNMRTFVQSLTLIVKNISMSLQFTRKNNKDNNNNNNKENNNYRQNLKLHVHKILFIRKPATVHFMCVHVHVTSPPLSFSLSPSLSPPLFLSPSLSLFSQFSCQEDEVHI